MWIFLAGVSACVQAIEFVFTKNVSKRIDPFVLSTMFAFVLLVCSWLRLLFVWWFTFYWYSNTFWAIVLASVIAFAVWRYFFTISLSLSDISVISPLLVLVPLFTLWTWAVILWEIPSVYWRIWVFLIILWSYFIKIWWNRWKWFFYPFIALWFDPWVKYMLYAAVLRSLINPLVKIVLEEIDVIWYLFLSELWVILISLPYVYYTRSQWLSTLTMLSNDKQVLQWVLLAWICKFLAKAAMILSFTYIFVVYSISITRLWSIVAVLLWWLVYNEKHIWWKLFASCIMIVWVLFISFW
jgi:drug/metabolite transporter (DMT)-like permease